MLFIILGALLIDYFYFATFDYTDCLIAHFKYWMQLNNCLFVLMLSLKFDLFFEA
jgi:hypothetical protein